MTDFGSQSFRGRDLVGICLVVALAVTLLAGEFTFERAGLANPLVVPERLFAMTAITCGVILHANSSPRPRRLYLGALVPTFFLFLLLLVSSFWTSPLADLSDDYTNLATMALACISVVVLIAHDDDLFVRVLLKCLWVSGLLFAIVGLASSGMDSRAAAFGGGPNVYSRVVAVGLIAMIVLWRTELISSKWLLASPVFLMAIIASGSRGGMLGALLGLLVVGPVLWAKRVQVLACLVAIGVLVPVVLGSAVDRVTRTFNERVIELTINQGYDSGRSALWDYALGMFDRSPVWGNGIRSFAVEYGRGFEYPHNLVLQLASEVGVVGIVGLFVALAAGSYAWWRLRRDPLVSGLFGCALVILMASMFSGDYYDTRYLWVLVVAVSSLWALRRGELAVGPEASRQGESSGQSLPSVDRARAGAQPDHRASRRLV